MVPIRTSLITLRIHVVHILSCRPERSIELKNSPKVPQSLLDGPPRRLNVRKTLRVYLKQGICLLVGLGNLHFCHCCGDNTPIDRIALFYRQVGEPLAY